MVRRKRCHVGDRIRYDGFIGETRVGTVEKIGSELIHVKLDKPRLPYFFETRQGVDESSLLDDWIQRFSKYEVIEYVEDMK